MSESKPGFKSSQNGGVMEGWNDIPAVLTSGTSGRKQRKKRVISQSYLDLGLDSGSSKSPEPPK